MGQSIKYNPFAVGPAPTAGSTSDPSAAINAAAQAAGLTPSGGSGPVTGQPKPGYGSGVAGAASAPGNPGVSSAGAGLSGANADLSISAATNPALNALLQRNNQNLTNIQNGTGHEMDVMGQKFRDAREGGRQSIQQSNLQRGVASSPDLANYEGETQRGVQSTLADVALGREKQYTDALQNSLGITEAPADLALREKGEDLQAYAAEQAAKNNAFSNFLNLLSTMKSMGDYSTAY